MQQFKQYLTENKTESMEVWHGGDLEGGYNEMLSHKKGRWEHGPGLYLTTHYDTAKKYSKGSRKLYKLIIAKGTDIGDVSIPMADIDEFMSVYLSKRNAAVVRERIERYIDGSNKVPAHIFVTIIINNDAIRSSETNNLRVFLVDHGVDYELVSSPFGWNEMMIVLFNMKKIVSKTRIQSTDKIETFDLPTEFQSFDV